MELKFGEAGLSVHIHFGHPTSSSRKKTRPVTGGPILLVFLLRGMIGEILQDHGQSLQGALHIGRAAAAQQPLQSSIRLVVEASITIPEHGKYLEDAVSGLTQETSPAVTVLGRPALHAKRWDMGVCTFVFSMRCFLLAEDCICMHLPSKLVFLHKL